MSMVPIITATVKIAHVVDVLRFVLVLEILFGSMNSFKTLMHRGHVVTVSCIAKNPMRQTFHQRCAFRKEATASDHTMINQ